MKPRAMTVTVRYQTCLGVVYGIPGAVRAVIPLAIAFRPEYRWVRVINIQYISTHILGHIKPEDLTK